MDSVQVDQPFSQTVRESLRTARNEHSYVIASTSCVSELIKRFVEMKDEYGDIFKIWAVGYLYVFLNDPDDIEVSRQ
jgi:hypothetical protein